jgi:predicted Zn-dependent protease
MPEIITCPHCQRRLQLPETLAGSRVVCPGCRTAFQATAVPLATAGPPVAPPGGEVPCLPEWEVPAMAPPAPAEKPNPWADLNADAPAAGRRKQKVSPERQAVKLIAVVLGLAVLYFALSDRKPWAPTPPVGTMKWAWEDPEQRRAEVIEALVNQPPLVPEEVAQELKPMLTGLGEAFRARDRERIAAHFDASRMLDELIAQGLFPAQLMGNRQNAIRTLSDALGRSLEKQAPLLEWTDFEIRNVKNLAGNEAVVIVRHATDAGVFLKMRWWVTKRSGSWKVYDMEDLDVGLRFSAVGASVAGMGFLQLQDAARATNHLRDAIHAVVAQDADLAEKKLALIEGLKLPAKLEPLRWMTRGLIRMQRGEFKEALTAFDEAQRLQADMPVLDFLKGITFNALGEWAKALKHLQTYRDLLGDDPLLCHELGEALRGLQRFPEAREAYRTALDLNPKNTDAFLGLLRALSPGDPRDDLARRFPKLENPRLHFETFADECKESQDGESLEQLALGMLKVDPAHAAADYYIALARVWRGQTEQASAPFRAALGKEKDPKSRQDFLRGFFQAMLNVGKPLAAYQAAPDATEAFRLMAGELRKSYRLEELRELLALHEQKQPNDVLLPFYRGELLVRDEEYEAAAKAFAAGMARPPDAATLAEFRHSRVLTRYHLGQALAAYAEIGPRAETFEQLTELCFMDQDYPLLQKLLDAHAKNQPNSFELLRTQARLKIKQKQVPEGIVLFKAALAKQPPKVQRDRMVAEFLSDMVAAGQTLEAYQAAPDAGQAFAILAPQLRSRSNGNELRRLLDAHRRQQPEDCWLSYYAGQLNVEEKAWDKAAAQFADGWKKAPDESRETFRHSYVHAMYMAGRALQAYRDVDADDRDEVFEQLVNLLSVDKKAAVLDALLNERSKDNPGDPDLLFHRARAKLFAGQPAAAVPLLQQAHQKQTLEFRRRHYVATFTTDMYQAGRVLEAYRASPDKSAAVETLARQLLADKKEKELETLLGEHRQGQPDDPWGRYYAGELHLLRGAAAQAEAEFAAALVKAPAQNQWTFRRGLRRAQLQAGHIAAAYRDAGQDRRAFEELANLCVAEKAPAPLEALIAAHRQAHPDDPTFPVWELEVQWLKQDYQSVVQRLAEPRQGVLAAARYRWKINDYLIRGLVKLGRTREAVQHAEASFKNRRGNVVLLLLAHAANGDVKQALAVMEKEAAPQYLREDCYDDLDLGPILRTDAFREFRQRFPDPEGERQR